MKIINIMSPNQQLEEKSSYEQDNWEYFSFLFEYRDVKNATQICQYLRYNILFG